MLSVFFFFWKSFTSGVVYTLRFVFLQFLLIYNYGRTVVPKVDAKMKNIYLIFIFQCTYYPLSLVILWMDSASTTVNCTLNTSYDLVFGQMMGNHITTTSWIILKFSGVVVSTRRIERWLNTAYRTFKSLVLI